MRAARPRRRAMRRAGRDRTTTSPAAEWPPSIRRTSPRPRCRRESAVPAPRPRDSAPQPGHAPRSRGRGDRSDAGSNPRSLQGPPMAATSSCRLGDSSLPPGIGLDHRRSNRRAMGGGRRSPHRPSCTHVKFGGELAPSEGLPFWEDWHKPRRGHTVAGGQSSSRDPHFGRGRRVGAAAPLWEIGTKTVSQTPRSRPLSGLNGAGC